jgi:hypothetical protein
METLKWIRNTIIVQSSSSFIFSLTLRPCHSKTSDFPYTFWIALKILLATIILSILIMFLNLSNHILLISDQEFYIILSVVG